MAQVLHRTMSEAKLLISLFITCYNDMLFPETGKAVVRIFEKLGHTVEFRSTQTCCGQMHLNSGYHDDAAKLMLRFLDVFGGAEVICAPSSSCVSVIREHYPKLAAEIGTDSVDRESPGDSATCF